MIGLLASYWAWRNIGLGPLDEWHGPLFIDSGAFSAHTTGAKIHVDEYGEWLQSQRDADVVCTLDVIGDPEATARNTERLRERWGVDAMPVFHVGTPWPELDELARGRALVGAGGMVGHKTRRAALTRWCLAVCRRAEEHGAKVHGLGMTSPYVLGRLPFYSVDSISWRSFIQYGLLLLWDDERGQVLLRRRERVHWFTNADLVRSYGLDPHVVTKEYATAKSAHRDEELALMYEVQARAAVRFDRWRDRRFGTIECDGYPPGPVLFLGIGAPGHHPDILRGLALALDDEPHRDPTLQGVRPAQA